LFFLNNSSETKDLLHKHVGKEDLLVVLVREEILFPINMMDGKDANEII